ncbi:MAG: hypothetical protein GVY28_04915 [Alphaproteobacteria bacterium]|jgi:hypothetical protein|nr:hypothetical protein [Alphaproteobacteria bacterium]
MHRMWMRLMCVGIVLVTLAAPAAARADQAADQAVWLLEKATLVHRNGFHNVLLRALRQMRDPRLEPLFSELVQRHHPALRIHGILGMSEIADPPRLDLTLVADLDNPTTQARLVSAAIDSDLLNVEDARQLLRWPGLPASVRVLVVGKLLGEGKTIDQAVLDDALASDHAALRCMAALLKAQLGHAEAIKVLQRLDETPRPTRERVRSLLLQTAVRYGLDSAAPWARNLVRAKLQEDNVGKPDWRMSPVGYQALRAALTFNDGEAVNLWMACFDQAAIADSPESERLRLAMLALDLAEDLDERIFQAMLDDDQGLIRTIGRVGRAIAAGQSRQAPIAQLIDQNNKLANAWALQYAARLSEDQPARARPLFVAIIGAAASDEPRFRAERLENAVVAVEKLHETAPNAGAVLRPMIAEASTYMQEAMLMGLIRSDGARPDQVIQGIDDYASRVAEAMALILQAKHAQTLGDERLKRLALIVRGGVRELQDPLRIQAAWTYLRLTQQDRVALATVLGAGPGAD